MTLYLALGLMSGTSMDGIDAALIETDGRDVARPVASRTIAYDEGFRERLRRILGGKGAVAQVERELTERHAEAVRDLLARAGVAPGRVAVIGFHGHTIAHAPERRHTWQIGDGARLAALTGIAVVSDFRSADVAAGGQGAPLVPLYHRALAMALERPLAVLNIGGVANVTWIGADGALLAFDTGPGNALIDDWILARTGRPFDAEGALAASGQADPQALAALLDHPYFDRAPPKSLDRDAFSAAPVQHLSPADGAATLAAFTVAAVARAREWMAAAPLRWLVGGGGRRNAALMAGLAHALRVPVEPVDAVGWSGDGLEAEAFAYLAVRSRLGLPISLPTTTGVPRPMTGGRFHAAG